MEGSTGAIQRQELAFIARARMAQENMASSQPRLRWRQLITDCHSLPIVTFFSQY
jgi:hypothetical protein